tara:strand:+ start:23 stop:799 length:777 start_codon:yes stop_codon:yes gene_type:complete
MLDKILDIISVFSPFILICVFVFMSVFNQDLKALIMIFGLFIAIFILKQIVSTVNITSSNVEDYRNVCTLFNEDETPGTSITIISYIFSYMIMPMIYNKNYNAIIILILLILYIFDIYHKLFVFGCYGEYGFMYSILGTIIGLTIGISYFLLLYSMGETDESYLHLLYFNVSKNNLVQCQRFKNTDYSCDFYDDDGNIIYEGIPKTSISTEGDESTDEHKAGITINNTESDIQEISDAIARLKSSNDNNTAKGGIHYH